MKKLLTFIFILISFSGFAQHWNKIYSYNEYLGLQSDSAMIPPGDTLRSVPNGSFAIKNNHVYQKLSTGIWSQVDGGGNAVQSLTGSQSIQYGTFASMPAPGTIGRFYAATDSSRWYFDNGISWLNLSGSGGGGGSGGAILTFGFGLMAGTYNGSTPVSIIVDSTIMSTRANRQKAVDSLNAIIATKVINFLNTQSLGYGPYASRPISGTGIYYASDSAAFFYINGATATNLTPIFNLYFRGKGQPGDTSYVFAQNNNIYVSARRDSIDFHSTINPDSSRTFYVQAHDSTSSNALETEYGADTARLAVYAALAGKVINNGASTSIKAGTFLSRPAASNCQCYYWSTDSVFWSYDNGTWKDLKPGNGGGGADSGIITLPQSGLQRSISGASVSLQSALNWQVVTNYGAVHDSTTDDAPAIQAAINYITNTSKKGVVYLPAGIYRANSTIHIPANTQINMLGAGGSYGSPPNSICKIINNTTTADGIVDSADFTIFKGFDIQNLNTTPTAGAGLHFVGKYPNISEMSIWGYYYDIWCENNTYPYIHNVDIIDASQYGIYLINNPFPDNGDAIISDCNFGVGSSTTPHATVAGIYQPNSGGLRVLNCKWNAGSPWFQNCIVATISSSTSDCLIDNNSFENFTGWAEDISIAGGSNFYNINIHGNQASSYRGGHGFRLTGAGGGVLSKGVINSNVINFVDTAIRLNNVTKMTISGNQIDSPTTVTFGLYQTGSTQIFYDRNTATESTAGLLSTYDKIFIDTLENYNRITSFLQPINLPPTPTVEDDFTRANTTDIAGSNPAPTAIGPWMDATGGTLGISSNHLYYSGGATQALYHTPGKNNYAYDLSVIVTNATLPASGGAAFLIGNYTTANTYLDLVFISNATGVGSMTLRQVIAGTTTVLYAGSATINNGDTVHLNVSGSTASVYQNSTFLGSGTFNNSTINGTDIGVEYYGNSVTTLNRFLQTVINISSLSLFGVNANPNAFKGLGTNISQLNLQDTITKVQSFGKKINLIDTVLFSSLSTIPIDTVNKKLLVWNPISKMAQAMNWQNVSSGSTPTLQQIITNERPGGGGFARQTKNDTISGQNLYNWRQDSVNNYVLNASNISINSTAAGNASISVTGSTIGLFGGLVEQNITENASFTLNQSLIGSHFVDLITPTANAIITLPAVGINQGVWYKVCNISTSASFSWSFGGATLLDAAGNTVTSIPNGYTYELLVPQNGTSNWRIKSISYVGATPTPFPNGLCVSNDLTGQTAAVATVTSYAVPGSGSFNTFRVGGYINVTATTLSPLIQLKVSWTDENSNSQTQSFFVQGATTGIGAIGANGYSPIDIRVKQGTTITMSTTVGGTGTETYDVGANISKLY